MINQNVVHNVVRVDYDDNADGTFDRSEIYGRNASGDIVRVDYDDNADGVAERVRFDPNADGQVDRAEIYTRDAGASGWDHFATAGDSLAAVGMPLYSRPAFADIDGDGDLDLVVGGRIRDEQPVGLRYFENTGDAVAPTFTARTEAELNPFHGFARELSQDGRVGVAPAFADVDGDGDLDLAVGERPGNIRYFENTGDATTPVFTRRTDAVANPFHDISVLVPDRTTAYAVPAFADLDGDGDLDLVVGERFGGIHYFENTGNARSPAFTKRTVVALNPFHGIDVGHVSTPAFADVDGDGDLDLVIGNDGGDARYFENIGDAEAPTFMERRGIANPYSGFNMGDSAAPTFADLDGDGALEFISSQAHRGILYYQPAPVRVQVEMYTRDGDGNIIRTEFDDDEDGNVDRIETYARNAAGDLIQTGFDDDADGTVDRTEEHRLTGSADGTQDDVGRRVERVHLDLGGDGAVDRADTRDAEGNLLRTEFDDDEDGIFDRSEAYTRDAESNLTRTDFDDDGDDIVDRSEAYTRDARGNKVRTEFDDDEDDAVDRIEIYVWDYRNNIIMRTEFDDDADGHADRVGFDNDRDGAVDLVEVHTRDGQGFVVRTDFYDGTDTNGIAGRSEFYVSDGFGRRRIARTVVRFDGDGDGAVDRAVSYASVANGHYPNIVISHVVRAEFDNDGDGIVDRSESYARSRNSNLVRVEFDDDGNGIVDRAEDYASPGDDWRVDAITRLDFDDDGDGNVDRGERYVRDGNGRILRAEFDNDGDGLVDSRSYFAATGHSLDAIAVKWSAAPAFADLDGDGDLDLALGADVKGEGLVHYFENTGNVTAAAFAQRTAIAGAHFNPFHGVLVSGHAVPAFADLNGDGDLDLAVGDVGGGISYYENAGSAMSPEFTRRANGANPFHDIDVVSSAAPAFADLDGDGDLDLAVGDLFGKVHYFENTGNAAAPTFERRAGAASPFNGIDTGARSSPDIIDVDGDGDLDLVVGLNDGTIKYYENMGSATAPVFTERTEIASANPFHGIDARLTAAPALADLDDDGVLEFIFGTSGHGLLYYQPASPRTETYTHNEAGTVVRTDFDDDGDGAIDWVAFDENGDGAVDRAEAYTYDAQRRLLKKVMVLGSEGDTGDAPVEEPEFEEAGGINLGRSVVEGDYARGGAGKATRADEEMGVHSSFESLLADMEDDAIVRSETYTRDAAGAVVRTDFDEGDDGVVERSETYARNAAGAVVRAEVERDDDAFVDEYRYDHDANGRFDWVGRDSDNDGMLDRLEFHGQWGAAGNPVVHTILLLGDGPAYTVAFHDGDGGQLASGWSGTGPGAPDGFAYSADLAVVSELQTAATAGSAGATLPVDAVLLAGVPQIDLAGAGAGSTDLTISTEALAVLADGDAGYLLRIDGDGDDILRFALDDFTAEDAVAVGGENYLQYRGTTGSFIVDPDVTLVAA